MLIPGSQGPLGKLPAEANVPLPEPRNVAPLSVPCSLLQGRQRHRPHFSKLFQAPTLGPNPQGLQDQFNESHFPIQMAF